jgi:type I restriction enzyme S subunit
MMYFRPDPSAVDYRFLLHSIYGPVVRTYIENASNGSTVGHLRLGQVAAIPVLTCPLVEQHAIVDRLEHELSRDLAVTARAQREVELIQEYRTRLISDVVTGKLDVRGVDLPAVEEVVDARMEEVLDGSEPTFEGEVDEADL